MLAALHAAPLGDDVYGDDPSVNALQCYAAQLLGFESALFFCSGTQSNLAALMSHCQRGDEYIVGQHAHTYKYEGGGAAVLGSIQPQPLEFQSDGSLDLQQVAAAIKPIDPHFARTRLLCLENTTAGKVLAPSYLVAARKFATQHQLRLHLDGARLFNAAVACQCEARELAQYFDSVSICLSKGLGAPVGSLLLGEADFISEARRWRKVLGGGMRQAGLLAAAGLLALQTNVLRLAEDHANAERLARGLATIPALRCEAAQTNMVFLDVPPPQVDALAQYLKEQGIIASVAARTRLVTHLDISQHDVDRVIEQINAFFTA